MTDIDDIKRRDRQSRDEWGEEWGDDQERVDRATLLAEVERLRKALEGAP